MKRIMWIQVWLEPKGILMLNKVLTSVEMCCYNKTVAVVCNKVRPFNDVSCPRKEGHDQGASLSGFFISRLNPQGGLANGRWFRTHPIKRLRLLARRRVNLQTVSQEQSRWVILATGPRKVALWKLKSDLMGAVVSMRWLKLDGDHPLVLPYCLNKVDQVPNSRHNSGYFIHPRS